MDSKDELSSNSHSPENGPLLRAVSTDEAPMELNDCLDEIGWGKYHIKIVIALGFSVGTVPEELWLCRKILEKLVCEYPKRSWSLYHGVVLGWFGVLILGCLTSGVISDRYGRRPVMIACCYLSILLNIILSVYPELFISTLLRYLIGFLTVGLIPPVFSYILEMTAAHCRSFGILVLGFIIGLISGIIAIINSHILHYEHWDVISPVVNALPKFVAVCFLHLLDESVRFLVVKNNVIKAKKAITSMSLTNNDQYLNLLINSEEPPSHVSFVELFKTTYIKQTLGLSIVAFSLSWMIHTFWSSITTDIETVNCGQLCRSHISVQHISTLGKTFLFTLPLFSITIILSYKINTNRLVTMGVLFVTTLVISTIEYLVRDNTGQELQWVLITAHSLAVYLASILLYLYTCEVYPTVIRAKSCSVIASVGLLAHVISNTVFEHYCTSPLKYCLNHIAAAVLGLVVMGVLWNFQTTTYEAHLTDGINGDNVRESDRINNHVSRYGADDSNSTSSK